MNNFKIKMESYKSIRLLDYLGQKFILCGSQEKIIIYSIKILDEIQVFFIILRHSI